MTALSILGASTQSSYTYGATKLSASAQAVIDAAVSEASANANTATSKSDSVSISTEAKLAAAEKVDNSKDFLVLSQDVRSTLDTQYAAAKANGDNASPDLSEMSGRALAAIALNKTGDFSRREMTAAKLELRERARAELVTVLKSGTALSALTSYNEQLIADYDGMSQEERDARGWTDKVRASAEAFVTAVNGTDDTPSLFEMLNDED